MASFTKVFMEVPKLHQREPGEIIYDESFVLDGHRFYMALPQFEALFREAIKSYDQAQELTSEGLSAFDFLIPDYETFLHNGKQVREIYDVLIQNLVVAWDIPNENGGVIPCNEDGKQSLTMTAKRQLSEKLIEVIRFRLVVM